MPAPRMPYVAMMTPFPESSALARVRAASTLALLLPLLVALAPACSRAASAPDAEAAVRSAEVAWAKALLSRDGAALDALLAPDYSLTTAVMTAPRATWMANALKWVTKVADVDVREVKVHGDTAIASARMHRVVKRDTPDPRLGTDLVDSMFVLTDVWIQRDGRWQVVSRHSTIALPDDRATKPADAGAPGVALDAASSKALVRRYVEELLNQGRVEVADDVVAIDYVMHPARPGPPGREGIKAFAAAQRDAAPDWHITVHEMIAEGDRVVVRATGSGTPQKPFAGLAPHTRVAIDWTAVYRVADGKIAEAWVAVGRPERVGL